MTMVRAKMTGTVKVAVLGSENVGKSAVTVRFLTKRFIGEYNSEIDLLYTYNLHLDDSSVDMEVLDACNAEVNDIAANNNIAWCDAIVIVYSICDRTSFSRAKKLIQNVQKSKSPAYVPILLLGNKTDLDHRRQVQDGDGHALALQYGCHFFEVSAADDQTNITQAFHSLVREVMTTKNNRSSIKPRRKTSFVQVSKAIASVFSMKQKQKEQVESRKPSL